MPIDSEIAGALAVPSQSLESGAFRLGFGCASLGSRVAARAGLQALFAAHEAGVTWFDVAPAYGAGEAEKLLGEFLQGRRDDVSVTTKVGIAPPARLGAIKLAYAVGRPALGAAAGLRRLFRKMSATRNRRLPLSAELVETSIAASLKRLRFDHVDVYALHDPEADDVRRDDVLRALERVLARGQARRVGVAGTLDACREASRAGESYQLIQMSAEDFAAGRAGFADCGKQVVLHSVFGVDGMRDRLAAALARDPERARRLAAFGYEGGAARAVADLLLDNAFAISPGGVVLASMFTAGHLAANIARASRRPSPRAPEILREMLA